MLISKSEFFKKWIFQKVNLKSEFWKVSFQNWISKSKFWKESFKKWIPKNKFPKVKKWEKPFPNWKPNTTISYIELDIIVSKLVVSLYSLIIHCALSLKLVELFSSHHWLIFPCSSNCLPLSSKPWVISCPITTPIPPKFNDLGKNCNKPYV